MDINEQKSCLICGTKKPINAFRDNNGKMTAICRQCLEQEDTDDQGGGGFQVDIVDKLAAIALKQEQIKTEATENFKAITERLDNQTEHSRNQDNPKKYSLSSLFNEKKTGEISQATADNKISQQQTHNTDSTAEKNNKESKVDNQTNKTQGRQNTLFSTTEHKQSTNNTNPQTIAVTQQNPTSLDGSEKLSATDKFNAAVTRSALFTVVPSAKTLDQATGKVHTVQQTADPKTKADSKLDALATQFIGNILRGPGRR